MPDADSKEPKRSKNNAPGKGSADDSQPSGRRPSALKVAITLGVISMLMLGFAIWRNQPPDPSQPEAGTPSASENSSPNRFGPAIVPLSRLAGLPKEMGHPVYWAGPRKGVDYELTIAKDGSVGIRYLPAGAKDTQQRVLTVATYPKDDALAAVQKLAAEPDAVSETTPSGAVVVSGTDTEQHGYLALAGSPFLIQAFSPGGQTAWSMLRSDQIAPIAG